jgi:CRISPR system Cascade subunit CasD
MRWLEATLQASMMSFGKVNIDRFAPTGRFPSRSMVTGLIGAALGLERNDVSNLQHLQDHLIIASALECEGRVLRDVQNAYLSSDPVWTTRGIPAKRAGGDDTLSQAVRRTKDYLEDAKVRLVIGLKQGCNYSLEDIANALRRPVYPLSIGRRTCLPSLPLVKGCNKDCIIEAANAYEALGSLVESGTAAQWPIGQGPEEGGPVSRIISEPGLRDWKSGMHRGFDEVVEGVTGNVLVNVFEEEF